MKKKPKRKLINADKEHDQIKKTYRLKKKKTQKITGRVDNFVYLSRLLSQKSQERKPPPHDESLLGKASKRPMTSRPGRIRICTDMQIISLASDSPRREVVTAQSNNRGKATFYTERKTPSQMKLRSRNLLSEHKAQSKTRSSLKTRPFTARITSAQSKQYQSHTSVLKLLQS